MASQPVYTESFEALNVFAVLIGAVIGLVIGLAINAVICYFTAENFKRIPQEHRLMEPAMVWLLMIPCFNVIWNFFVFPRLSKSFEGYFQAQGIVEAGDCNYKLAMAYCIVCAVTVFLGWIPCIGPIIGIGGLVLLIIMLVQFNSLKNRIPEAV